MKTIYALLALFVLGLHPLLAQGTVSGGYGKGKTGGEVPSLPGSDPNFGMPKDLADIIREKLKDPVSKKKADDFLTKYNLPKSNEITTAELKHLINELRNDPRAQPVEPAVAGEILINAWENTHPDLPVPADIMNLKNEVECSGVAAILVALREELRKKDATDFFNPTIVGQIDSEVSEKVSIETAIKIMDGYEAKCLTFPSTLGASLRDWMSHVVGVLRFEGAGEHCIGTLISEREVLTARHCIFERDYDQWKLTQWTSLQFTLPADPDRSWEVEDRRDPPGVDQSAFDESDDADDWVILVLKNPILTVSAPKLSAPQSFDPLLLFSFQPLLHHRDVLAEYIGLPLSAGSWADRIRVDNSSSCRISLISTGGCLTHGCQSEGGVSGAPLFRQGKNGEMPALVALHQGSISSTYKGTCLKFDDSALPNRGRALSETFLTSLGAQATQAALNGGTK